MKAEDFFLKKKPAAHAGRLWFVLTDDAALIPP
jgi:hypothetical protein